MKRLVIILFALAGLAGCGKEEPPATVIPRKSSEPAPVAGKARMTEFFFYKADPGGVEQRPSFVMRTPKVSINAEGEAILEDVQAEIYGRNNEVTKIWAENGRFDQETKTATMKGDVVLERGAMQVEMEDLVWSDETRVAKTQKPVRILDEGTELHADNMAFHPDENALLLDNVVGDVKLAGRSES
ncbi:MAG: LPS export ABC transporter periplasmic protein LptC [Candidatus Hydrogenedentota bacterium]